MFNMLACNRSLWAKISSIKRQSGAGGVGIALCTNSALSIQDLQGDNGSFLSRSPRLYQPELWQFNLFSVFQHELWMNPATSECGGDLRWSSSLLLRNSSFLCQRLGVDLKEVREREKKIKVICSASKQSILLTCRYSRGGRLVIDCWELKPISCVHPAIEPLLTNN